MGTMFFIQVNKVYHAINTRELRLAMRFSSASIEEGYLLGLIPRS